MKNIENGFSNKNINTENRMLFGFIHRVFKTLFLMCMLMIVLVNTGYAADPLPPISACPTNLNSCSAGELTTSVKSVMAATSDPTCSGPNDTIDLVMTLTYAATAGTRYDLGTFIALDGGSLSDSGSTATSCGGAASQVGGGILNAYPADSDTDLFLNEDSDSCGDVNKTAGPVDWSVSATVSCKNIQDGFLNIASCRIWQQNAQTACSTLSQAGTGSKCDCTPLVLEGLGGFGKIKVVKDLSPSTDLGKFNLEIDEVINAENVGDGGTTDFIDVNEGIHSVGESAGTGTVLDDYTSTISCSTAGSVVNICTNTNTNGTSCDVDVNSDDEITCTITNTKTAIPITLTKDWDGSPIGDSVTLDITGGTDSVQGMNSNDGTANNDSVATANVSPGNEITLSETFITTANSVNYDTTLVCDDGNGGAINSVLNGNILTVDSDDTVIECTLTNTRKGNNVTIVKAWAGDATDG
ncbi:hypothetical protein, partial [uncultured Cocleimonas sp.]|uniref:hypothetical protein n=1 Tax=uncultured Cocleimonas sp. TaxID=1051587 RepID=UPI00263350CE